MKYPFFNYLRFCFALSIMLTTNVQASIINMDLTFGGQSGSSSLDLNINTDTFTGIIDSTHTAGLVQAKFLSSVYTPPKLLTNFEFEFESFYDFVNGDLTLFDQFDVSKINLNFDNFIGLGLGYFNFVNSSFHWLESASVTCIANCGTSNNIPEPSIFVLMSFGLLGLGISRRKIISRVKV